MRAKTVNSLPAGETAGKSSFTLHVTGDAYKALFYVPPFNYFAQISDDIHEAYAHAMPVGVEYIYRAIRAVCDPDALLLKQELNEIGLSRASDYVPSSGAGHQQFARYEVTTVGEVDPLPSGQPDERIPLMRLTQSESTTVNVANAGISYKLAVKRPATRNVAADILVHWFGEMASRRRESVALGDAPECDYHVQIGLPIRFGSNDCGDIKPHSLANPSKARFVVVNIGEISESHRIRRSLSYEAIAVDLLRMLRGVNKTPFTTDADDVRMRLGLTGTQTSQNNFLLVRLNNSAVFVYGCDSNGQVETAWIVCHKAESAPLSQPELGQMVGYTGFVSAHLCGMLRSLRTFATEPNLTDQVLDAVRRSLLWQRATFDRGCFHLLMKRSGDKWVPTEADPAKALIGYDYMFIDVARSLERSYPRNTGVNAGSQPHPIKRFDVGFKDLLSVEVDITRAVAHRNPWFMARSVVFGVESREGDVLKEVEKAARFVHVAESWLVGKQNTNQAQRGPDVPVVNIGKARLTDRREIEDFLAIHHALQVYARAAEQRAPLNIAVFGAPGSGKSFAVKQVVDHLTKTQKRSFRKQELTFNVGQFKTLNDLPDALHLVRNECLSGEIPIVFFDEFDASFQGQPFGWLKYFLAPMQDGEFYHAGQTFKVGRAVFVFAGGVNRSFDELNGRVRNPGFCEAKGPDFISRLKAHLNVQGINKPDDIETDEYRYILRRGKLLQDILRQKLGYADDIKRPSLLHPSVARALLTVDRFKHGVRSLEAIIKMCSARIGHPIGPSDLPSMSQLEMHVDASKLLDIVDREVKANERLGQAPAPNNTRLSH